MLKPPANSHAVSSMEPNMPFPTYGRVLRSLASEPGQVSLKAGDTVKILESTTDGYLITEMGGLFGLVPAHLVEIEQPAQGKRKGRNGQILRRGSSSPGVKVFMNNQLFGMDEPPSKPTSSSPSKHESEPTEAKPIEETSAQQPSPAGGGRKRPAPDKMLLTSPAYKAVLSKSGPLLVIKSLNIQENPSNLPAKELSEGAGNLLVAGSISCTGAVQVIKQGYLLKKGHKRRNWTKRWFVLRADKKLRYLVSPGEKTLKGEVQLTSETVVSRAQDLKNPQSHPYCLQVVVPGTETNAPASIYLDASSPEEMILWVQALQRVIKAQDTASRPDPIATCTQD